VRADQAARGSRCCAVVDANATGQFLPAAIEARGTRCVFVRSQGPPVSAWGDRHRPVTEVRHRGDVARTAAALRALGVDAVVAGGESGAELAAVLSGRLGLPGNGASRPSARRDKHEMTEAVRQAGLATARTEVFSTAGELATWARATDRGPVVVKPVRSGGADCVFFCFTPEQAATAARRILETANKYGEANTRVLGQEFLAGDEYFVNTVSRDGVHHIVDIWRYHKRWVHGSRPIYDYEHPVAARSPAAVAVGEYALAVLDALEIANGAAHTEVMLTASGPVLVECGARPGGSHRPDIDARCLGASQVDVMALAIAEPARFARLAGTPYRLATNLRYVSMISPRPGTVPGPGALELVRALPSFAAMVLTLPAGAALPQTVDLATSPGYVYLASADAAQIDGDYLRLRELEDVCLYSGSAVAA
jgi:biotin carboxylase